MYNAILLHCPQLLAVASAADQEIDGGMSDLVGLTHSLQTRERYGGRI